MCVCDVCCVLQGWRQGGREKGVAKRKRIREGKLNARRKKMAGKENDM